MLHYTIEELLRNNRAWAAQKKALQASYFDELDRDQTPPYLYVGCSDSRLPLTNFTQTEPGEIFVHRNIANQVCLTDINFLSVLDYAIAHLNVEHIIVCGHYNCGGIIAALEGTTTGLVDNWVNPIRELYLEHQREIDGLNSREQRINRLAELNVIAQVNNLYQIPILRKCIREGTAPKIHGWVLNLKTGLIEELKIQNPGRDLWSIQTEAISH
ncbi:MAG: carbonic anhydrase [Synechococcaceae cyanobacterium RL_1_2]|nr:carbonic anhydrase [Synechococcaceae cyanobacterium RL_1_2]